MSRTQTAPTHADLRAALAAGPAVVKLGGAALEAEHHDAPVWAFLSRLAAASSAGLVIVHGGGVAVDRHLARLGIASVRRDGIRITPADQIDQVVAVLAGLVNKRLVARLGGAGLRPVGLCLADGGLARGVLDRSLGFDAGRVGTCDGGDPGLLRVLLGEGFTPVISSIAFDAEGEPLNVNADLAAAAIACIANAGLTLLLTDTPGILDEGGETIARLTPAVADALIASGTVRGGMVVKARAALDVARASGSPVLIAPWNDPALLDPLLRSGAGGTLVTRSAD